MLNKIPLITAIFMARGTGFNYLELLEFLIKNAEKLRFKNWKYIKNIDHAYA